jgi:crotonobetainyl-CoA:carnitine CoA-transferase CaiB-like acyl-CoA transferase
VVRSLTEALAEPWAAERGALVDVGGERGEIRVPRSPLRFSSLDVGSRPHPGSQGEHNHEVLARLLGLGRDELDRLGQAGVLVERPVSGQD